VIDRDAIREEFREQVGELPGLSLDLERLEAFAAGIASGQIGPDANVFDPAPIPATGEQVDVSDEFSEAQRSRCLERGREEISAGRVAVAVLNGGMATRFGGDVKGILEAVSGRSFLEIKLEQGRRLGDVPFLVMNSFATHARTRAFLEEHGLAEGVETFLQDVSLRLTPEGEVFRDADGRISPYAPGHGDFPEALRRSGLLERLRERDVRLVQLSNIDNLGAELDPLLIGYHLEHGRPLTAEVAKTLPGDVGGAPAFAQGRLQIVEGFRFPADFDFGTVPFMATNTFLMSLDLLAEPHELTWFYVRKQVDGRAAIQMERLVNELSSRVETAYVATPRGGPEGRFFPIKTRDDLARLRADAALVERFGR
jgi:UTP--glucose-1-phosphate uridylyltransferase